MHDVQNPSKHSKKRQLGNTKVEVSALGFSGSPIGDKSSEISMDNVMEAVEPIFNYSHQGVLQSVEASLDRIGLERFNILLIHDGTAKTLTNVM